MRFPGFTDEWKAAKLDKLVSFLDEQRKPIKSEDRISEKGLYPYYGASGIIDYVDDYIFDGDHILLSEDGANIIDRNYPVAFIAKGKKWINNHAHVLLPQKDIDIDFLTQSLERKNYVPFNTGTTMPKLNKETCKNLLIKVPGREEQRKIGKLLSLIEARITTQNKIIEDLKKLKSAIIDKLYSEVIGKEYSYSELLSIVTERNTNRTYSKVIAASQEYGMIERDSLNLKVQFDDSSLHTYKIIHPGDYVIHLRSFQGGYAFSRLKGICSPAYIILRPHESVEYGYFEHYFTSTKFVNSLRLVTYGIRDGRSINVDEWMSMKVVLPSNEEQDKIIRTIQSIDSKLENENKIFTVLSQQRQFLLRQLFI